MRRVTAVGLLSLTAAVLTLAFAQDSKLTRDNARKLKAPIANTRKSIDRGRVLFLQACTGCHGADGKAETAVIAEATDLTAPDVYKNGTTEGEIFRSIRDGAGNQMPGFQDQISKEEDIWNVVNFVRSLWPAAVRPPLQNEK